MNIGFVELRSYHVQFYLEMVERTDQYKPFFFSTRKDVRRKIQSYDFSVNPMYVADAFSSCNDAVSSIPDKEWLKTKNPANLARQAEKNYPLLEAFIDSNKLDAIFVWNGSDLIPGIAVYIAKKRGVKIIYAENGLFPDTMQMDREGVNAKSSLSRRFKDYSPAERFSDNRFFLRKKEAEETRKNYGSPRKKIKKSFLSLLKKEWMAWIKKISVVKKASPLCFASNIPSNPFIFLPLQVSRDSNLLINSPVYGKNQILLVLDLLKAIEGLEGEYKLVIKTHPGEEDSSYLDSFINLSDRLVILGDQFSTIDIVNQSNAVVTINSTVGFESIAQYKPTLMVGENYYYCESFIKKINKREELASALMNAVSMNIDEGMVNRYLEEVYSHTVVATSNDFSGRSMDEVNGSIMRILCE